MHRSKRQQFSSGRRNNEVTSFGSSIFGGCSRCRRNEVHENDGAPKWRKKREWERWNDSGSTNSGPNSDRSNEATSQSRRNICCKFDTAGLCQFMDLVQCLSNFQYMYETENGIQMQEQGFQKEGEKKDKEGKKEQISVAQGSYSYTSPEGVEIAVSYIADENGFQTFENEMPPNGQRPAQKMQQNGGQKATMQKPTTTSGPQKAAAAQPQPTYYFTYAPKTTAEEEMDEDEQDEEMQDAPPMIYRHHRY